MSAACAEVLADRAPSLVLGGLGLRYFAGRIKIQDSPARVAGNDLLIGADFLPCLWTHHNKAGHAFLVAGLGNGGFALPHDAVIMGQCAVIHACAQLVALTFESGQQLLVFSGTHMGFSLFFLHVG